MQMKMTTRFLSSILLLTLVGLQLLGCTPASQPPETDPTEDFTVNMDMNTDFAVPDSLPDGGGQKVKVILLLGQSNASGASINAYLEKAVGKEQYARYEAGFDSVQINYCVDDHNATSEGSFVKVDMTCGANDGFFGPEVGMAEVLSEAYPDETLFILKYTMSGYSLHHHWLCQQQRGSIYNACITFLRTYMDYLRQKNYDASIGAICWMQGESDTSEFKASKYFENQKAFVSYLREDLETYEEEGGIWFIDAGISSSPYCEPGYPQINEAKRQFSELSPMNLYFSTIDAGLITTQEPEGDPDWGHYDALCELELGRLFGRYVVQSYESR
jgi:hypothetical protein